MSRKVAVLDLFSGIGGFSLGLERTGRFQTVAFCELDPFCRAVLAKHWPDVPCHDDITTREFHEGEADVICGGFPCQDVSCAGKRAGLPGSRSGLYRELVRAIRVVRPQHAIVENVAALLSDGMGTVLGDMAESGFDLEWDCVPACAIGAPHERDRVWIVAHAHNERCGEARQFRHRSEQVSPGRAEATVATDAGGAGSFPAAHSGIHCSEESTGARHVEFGGHASPSPPDAKSERWRQGGTGRPPDSFAGIRIETRRYVTNAPGSGLEGREISEGARGPQPEPASRYFWPWPNRWPDEPPLSGVDDGIPDWVDRTKSTGNAVLPQIPEIIGRALP